MCLSNVLRNPLNSFPQPYLVDLYNSTPDKKDGVSMADSYKGIIDFVERNYCCRVVALGTDDDGGSKCGRGLVEDDHPWIFIFPCGAHHVSISHVQFHIKS